MLLVDLLLIALLSGYAYLGYRQGFIRQSGELLTFLVAFFAALAMYQPLGLSLADLTKWPPAISGLVAFMISWLLLELLLGFGWRWLRGKVPPDIQDAPANRIAGPVPGVVRGLVLAMIILLIVASAPLPAATKQPFTQSALAKPLLAAGTVFQQQFNNLFGNALKDTLAFKTIKTDSSDSVALGYTTTGSICSGDETAMIRLVNEERRKQQLDPVRSDAGLRDVARAHSQDMFSRGYFAHVTPDGIDPFQRMDAAGITYSVAGENLALAPTVEVAMTGLMNSPGHRANILKPEYTRLGVGCIDGGSRGKMFSQEFAG